MNRLIIRQDLFEKSRLIILDETINIPIIHHSRILNTELVYCNKFHFQSFFNNPKLNSEQETATC
ncbi:MAG: hypothetical protein N4A49_14255 [Marinifilaceae bacterium]|jgi:hypothetical protein|nr:hypothetical protein [Marinifilaceae bacterium]